MSKNHEIKIGDTATVKVGRNEAKVKILTPMAGGNAFMVKSLSSGKEFIVPGNRLNVPTVSIEPVAPPPAPEAAPTMHAFGTGPNACMANVTDKKVLRSCRWTF